MHRQKQVLFWVCVLLATTGCLPDSYTNSEISQRICLDTWKNKKEVVNLPGCLDLVQSTGADISAALIECSKADDCPDSQNLCELSACNEFGYCTFTKHPLCEEDGVAQNDVSPVDVAETTVGDAKGDSHEVTEDVSVQDVDDIDVTPEDIEDSSLVDVDEVDSSTEPDFQSEPDLQSEDVDDGEVDSSSDATPTVDDVLTFDIEETLDSESETIDASPDAFEDDSDSEGQDVTDDDSSETDTSEIIDSGDMSDADSEDVGKEDIVSEDAGSDTVLCKTHQDCDDGDVCTLNLCEKGACVITNAVANCDDGNPCTEKDFCSFGVCYGYPKTCDDGNMCTDDSCDKETGCVFSPNTKFCDDKDSCSEKDVCKDKTCKGEPLTCDDGNECTDDSCKAEVGCVNAYANDKPCKDESKCILVGNCTTGSCVATTTSCDDGNSCTDDSCTVSGCMHEKIAFCCNKDEDCQGDNPCIKYVCSTKKNTCAYASVPVKTPCDDGDPCTEDDRCKLIGACQGDKKSCDDGNGCTLDSCDKVKGCEHQNEPDGTACSDGDACTLNEECKSSVCTYYSQVTCDDADPCTEDSCNKTSGSCEHTKISPCTVPVYTANFSCDGTGKSEWKFTQKSTPNMAKWNIDAMTGITTPSGTCSLNFNGADGSSCGTANCNDVAYASGIAQINKLFDFSDTSITEVKATFSLLKAIEVPNQVLTVQASVDGFSGDNPLSTDCNQANMNTSSTWSFDTPNTDSTKWEAVSINLTKLAGKKDVKIQFRFIFCGWTKPTGGPAIDNLSILVVKK